MRRALVIASLGLLCGCEGHHLSRYELNAQVGRNLKNSEFLGEGSAMWSAGVKAYIDIK